MSARHPFVSRPHRTFVELSFPVLVSLTAEPLTGLIDTAFVARLGGAPLAGLGVATALLAGVLWVFNFLAIGTQTEVATSLGGDDRDSIRHATGTAITLAAALGVLLIAILWPNLEAACGLFSSDPAVVDAAARYLRIRLLGAPAFLVGLALFGAFRGMQDMRTPLLIAVGVNAANIALDAMLIHGVGRLPALGIEGAAWASLISQVAGAAFAFILFRRWHGMARPTSLGRARPMFRIGRDLVVRTGTLLLFMMYTTRVANTVSVEAGATHQAIRQMWIFSAFLLDAYATTAQSLLGYFIGIHNMEQARRVARLAFQWGVGTGLVTAAVMLSASGPVCRALLGHAPTATFLHAWWIAALAQPVNALSFVTDGIHWGTGDYRYLRNAMLVASGSGIALLSHLEHSNHPTLAQVWVVIALWIAVRAAFGVGRIWPTPHGPLATN